MIEVSEQTIDRLHTVLAGIENGIDKVLKPAFGRALQSGKTEAKRQAMQTYYIKAGDYNQNSYIRYQGVEHKADEIIGTVSFAGNPMALIKYKTSPTTPEQGKTPSAVVLRENKPVKFNRRNDVFIQQMGSHIGIFKREENGKIKKLYGPSTPKMTDNEKVKQAVEQKVHEVLNRRINHEIDRLLSGNGG